MDQALPGLCKAHCESAQSLHESKPGADLPPAIFLPTCWLLRMLPTLLPDATLALSPAPLAHWPPGQPHLYLIHQVFRL